jgi:uncharacterized damage-inducible protein DinB
MLESMLNEFREESATTRRVLQRVPGDKLSWKPHPKSMSLGQLANHIAQVPGRLARLVQQDSFDLLQGYFVPQQLHSRDEILATFEQSARDAEDCLANMTEQAAQGPWRLMRGNTEVSTRPRDSNHRVKSLVSPPRTTFGVSAIAGCACISDLRTDRGREPIRVTVGIVHAIVRGCCS